MALFNEEPQIDPEVENLFPVTSVEDRIVFAFQEGLKVGRAEVLTALADSTRNLNRKYGSPE